MQANVCIKKRRNSQGKINRLYTDSRGKKGDPNYIITYYLQQNTFIDSQVPEPIVECLEDEHRFTAKNKAWVPNSYLRLAKNALELGTV